MTVNIWLEPVDKRDHFEIELHDGREILVGRHPDCGVCLSHSTVARHHCFISYQDGVTVIRDLGSRYGISVNGHRVDRATLAPGDLVMFGKEVEYVVRDRQAERAGA